MGPVDWRVRPDLVPPDRIRKARKTRILPLAMGFTGTRHGLTQTQEQFIRDFLLGKINRIEYKGKVVRIDEKITRVHHGGCVGGDEFIHNTILDETTAIGIIVHPPINKAWAADLRIDDPRVEVWEEKDYLPRDRDIVKNTRFLLGAPLTRKPAHRGSGTWYTLNYATKVHRPTLIVHTDGEVEFRENGQGT